MRKAPTNYANVDFTGMRFGRLTVVEKANHDKSWWKCKCDCGNEKELVAWVLVKSKSCGCLEEENRKALSSYNKTHGMTNSRLYSVWCGMKDRCTNPNLEHYDRYGGRGIKVCDEWMRSFESFYEWAIGAGFDETKSGKEQSIDRIDVNGNYEPNNCRWVTQKEQGRNRSDTLYIDYNGNRISIREFCEEHGITYIHFVFRRLNKGMTAEQILSDWKIKSNSSEYMTVNQAVEYYGVCDATVRSWICKGLISAEKHGSALYIRKGQPAPYSKKKSK